MKVLKLKGASSFGIWSPLAGNILLSVHVWENILSEHRVADHDFEITHLFRLGPKDPVYILSYYLHRCLFQLFVFYLLVSAGFLVKFTTTW